MTGLKALVGVAVVVGGAAVPARAAELQAATLSAWQEYLRGADERMQARLHAGTSFLWTDEAAGRALRVRRGEVPVVPAAGRGITVVPNGLIHDWMGAVFIPNATIASLLAVVHDYDRYKEVYPPAVAESKGLGCNAEDHEFSMIWQRRVLFVNAAIEGWYRAHDISVDARRGYSVADTTQVREIEDYGRATEHLLPPGSGNGFIWRMHSIARYAERDGGVYLEIEAIALTRDVPPSLKWLVNPVVNHLSINSLTSTLRQTRVAVDSGEVHEPRAKCPGRRADSVTLSADETPGNVSAPSRQP